MSDEKNQCPKCGSALGEVITTKSGRRLQRCSTGTWNETTKETEGCDFVKWLPFEPQLLDEKCPKCGAALVFYITKFNKRMKKCSTNIWDPQTRTTSGCDYVEWIKGTTEELNEDCPKCGSKLVLFTSASGKKLKKCSTNQWDRSTGTTTGCSFVEWQN